MTFQQYQDQWQRTHGPNRVFACYGLWGSSQSRATWVEWEAFKTAKLFEGWEVAERETNFLGMGWSAMFSKEAETDYQI